MKSLIYIEVQKQVDFAYQKGLVVQIKKLLPDIETFDLDNHSDPVLFNYAIDLLRRSEQCAIVFKAEKEAPPGRIMLLIEEILKNKDKALIILNGENSFIEKVSKQLNKFESTNNPDYSLQLILNFFKTSL